MLFIYNTLTRRKEIFKPIKEDNIKMYVCGPTVYDVPHIGHARSAYIFDIIRRYLEYSGYKVCFVRNVTDIDDKIINKAVSELEKIGEVISQNRLRERVQEVAQRYLYMYHQEMDLLGIRPPTVEPKATENIEKMIDFIKVLIEKGHAYVADGNVYFSVESFSGYGKLSNQNKDEMMEAVRIDPDKNKRHTLDFALWKKSKPSEPSWASPWGEGRPGWHIECSVMSTNILGTRFDIHGGGLDLIFPHHENEIAQSEAATGETFANYWIHNGLLSVNSEKMSKSLNNYITIDDFLKKYKDADLLKIIFLNSHYRSPLDYTEEKIEEAKHSKERIMIFLEKADRINKERAITVKKCDGLCDVDVITKAQDVADSIQSRFSEKMNDDFNAPAAFAAIFEAVKLGNDCLLDEALPLEEKIYVTSAVKNSILKCANIFGLSLKPVKLDKDLANGVENLVAEREKARKRKDFAAADKIRKELMDMGIVVEDTPKGPVWRKI
ncbi:MAG: cysteine--tRNA ligase [Candidatus Omnitrophica bacterium]|nr:cysteine--tRNA ligase [Candidatus Omnitrophota bacterium]